MTRKDTDWIRPPIAAILISFLSQSHTSSPPYSSLTSLASPSLSHHWPSRLTSSSPPSLISISHSLRLRHSTHLSHSLRLSFSVSGSHSHTLTCLRISGSPLLSPLRSACFSGSASNLSATLISAAPPPTSPSRLRLQNLSSEFAPPTTWY